MRVMDGGRAPVSQGLRSWPQVVRTGSGSSPASVWHAQLVRGPDSLPFRGQVVWLTADQGGRASGPPPTPVDDDYAATAYVPPARLADGLASFVLRVDDRSAWRSTATGGWLIVANEPPQQVQIGSVVVITEGPRDVAYFHVGELVEESTPA